MKPGSVDLPVIVNNEYIKKTEILPQPEDDPPVAMAAAVKTIEIYMVLEQVCYDRVHFHLILTHAPGLVCDQRPGTNTCRRFFSKRPSARPQRPLEAGSEATGQGMYSFSHGASMRLRG